MDADKHPANEDNLQTQGRKDNAAQPLNAADSNAGAERYPATKRDDSVDVAGESRTFENGNPAPRQGAGDISPSVNDGRMGPGGDPVEGKR